MNLDEVYLGSNIALSIEKVYKGTDLIFERNASYGTDAFTWWEMETSADYTLVQDSRQK